jgi:hypothetical protein
VDLFSKVAAAFGLKADDVEARKAKRERELDAVTLDNTRARRRFAERRRAAMSRQVKRARRRGQTQHQHAERIAAGQHMVLTGAGARGPVQVSPAMRANVERAVRKQVIDAEAAALRAEGKPKFGTREFDRQLNRNVKRALSEVGL